MEDFLPNLRAFPFDLVVLFAALNRHRSTRAKYPLAEPMSCDGGAVTLVVMC